MDSTPPSSIANKNEATKGQEKRFLSAAVESISPWSSSRSTTPKPKDVDKDMRQGEESLKNQHGGLNTDHNTSNWRGLSRRRYPSDCPEL